jgi:hypothetical protein
MEYSYEAEYKYFLRIGKKHKENDKDGRHEKDNENINNNNDRSHKGGDLV